MHIYAYSVLCYNIPVCEFITVYLSILLSIDIWIFFKLFVLFLFAITANIALITFFKSCFLSDAYVFLYGYVPRYEISVSQGKFVFTFSRYIFCSFK